MQIKGFFGSLPVFVFEAVPAQRLLQAGGPGQEGTPGDHLTTFIHSFYYYYYYRVRVLDVRR